MSVDHLRRGGSAGPWSAWTAFFLLSACSADGQSPEPSARTAAGVDTPSFPAARPVRSEPSPELRARVSQMPAFARLPKSDQAWVLDKVAARASEASGRELEPLVQQLAEVRQFAVSEREEPMPAPRPEVSEVP